MSGWARPFVVGSTREAPARDRRLTMAKYLVSVDSVEGAVREPIAAEQMQQFMEQVGSLGGR